MIPARKSRLFSSWFVRQAVRRIRSSFGSVRVRGLEGLEAVLRDAPVLVVSNHTAWWDPLVVLYLCARVLRTDAYALMDAKSLRQLPFFGKVGAFGVDLDDPEDGARVIRYAARLLGRSGRLVWMFPQGRELPVTARPLGFRPGSAGIAVVARAARVVPAAIRYEHGRLPMPCIYVAFGPPLPPERSMARATELQEEAVGRELDRIDRMLVAGHTSEFRALYEAGPGWISKLQERMLAWLTRPRP